MICSENDNEAELIRRIKQGESSAMKTAYCRYIKYLTVVCSRYIINDDDIKDILQDSFVKIFTSINKFEYRKEGSLKAWMTRIVVNESLKLLRRNEKFDAIQYEWDLPDVIDDNEPQMNDIPASVILEMIHQLPTGYRTVFNLYVFEKKSHKEIASILNIKENTSASQLHRAKDMLATKINQYNSLSRWKSNG